MQNSKQLQSSTTENPSPLKRARTMLSFVSINDELPPEIIYSILCFLPKHLAIASEACKLWRALALRASKGELFHFYSTLTSQSLVQWASKRGLFLSLKDNIKIGTGMELDMLNKLPKEEVSRLRESEGELMINTALEARNPDVVLWFILRGFPWKPKVVRRLIKWDYSRHAGQLILNFPARFFEFPLFYVAGKYGSLGIIKWLNDPSHFPESKPELHKLWLLQQKSRSRAMEGALVAGRLNAVKALLALGFSLTSGDRIFMPQTGFWNNYFNNLGVPRVLPSELTPRGASRMCMSIARLAPMEVLLRSPAADSDLRVILILLERGIAEEEIRNFWSQRKPSLKHWEKLELWLIKDNRVELMRFALTQGCKSTEKSLFNITRFSSPEMLNLLSQNYISGIGINSELAYFNPECFKLLAERIFSNSNADDIISIAISPPGTKLVEWVLERFNLTPKPAHIDFAICLGRWRTVHFLLSKNPVPLVDSTWAAVFKDRQINSLKWLIDRKVPWPSSLGVELMEKFPEGVRFMLSHGIPLSNPALLHAIIVSARCTEIILGFLSPRDTVGFYKSIIDKCTASWQFADILKFEIPMKIESVVAAFRKGLITHETSNLLIQKRVDSAILNCDLSIIQEAKEFNLDLVLGDLRILQKILDQALATRKLEVFSEAHHKGLISAEEMLSSQNKVLQNAIYFKNMEMLVKACKLGVLSQADLLLQAEECLKQSLNFCTLSSIQELHRFGFLSKKDASEKVREIATSALSRDKSYVLKKLPEFNDIFDALALSNFIEHSLTLAEANFNLGTLVNFCESGLIKNERKNYLVHKWIKKDSNPSSKLDKIVLATSMKLIRRETARNLVNEIIAHAGDDPALMNKASSSFNEL